MKKFYFFLLTVALSTSMMAQHNRHQYRYETLEAVRTGINYSQADAMAMSKKAKDNNFLYKMTGYHTDDNFEVVNYHYDAQNRVIAMYIYMLSDDGIIECFDSLTYDENNNIIKNREFQLLSDGWKMVNYIDYTYDEKGNMITRTNYNLYGGEYVLGGVYTYTYNDDNNMTHLSLDFADVEFTTADYTYDSQKRLVREYWKVYNYDTHQLAPDEVLNYNYNSNGKLEVTYDSLYDGYWRYNFREEYTYDNRGNCTRYEKIQGSRPVAKSEYFFDDRTVAETLIPQIPEYELPKIYTNNNLYSYEYWYRVNDNTGQLQYICNYWYGYAGYNGIASTEVSPITVYPNPAVEQATINAPQGAKVNVIDVQGRVVSQFTMNADSQLLNVKNFVPGVYTIQIEGTQHSTRMIVK